MPYAPSNPYAGFFNFGDQAAYGQQSFVPNPTGTLSPGTLSAMGTPSGGFNPTLSEFMATHRRDVAYQQFVARSLGTDPTTRTFSNMALEALTSDKLTRQMMASKYGTSNIDQLIGFGLSMPGISSMMGGSARSLSLGALAAGTSGLRWNNMGMIGDGQIQLNSSQRILEMMRSSFYTGSGAQKLDMTQGLNKDQMGAILSAGGAQGAFAGLDMGTISRKGGMTFNESSLNKIKDFTKNAAKAISSIIDIYGDANFNELFDKAQRITGVDFSRMGNANIMQSRLSALRSTARVSGIDTQTMFDLSAGLVNYGVANGFSPSAAGAIASGVQGQAAWQYQMGRQAAGSFYSPTRGLGDWATSLGRDRMGMVRDPLGARRSAVELLIQDRAITGNADIDAARAITQVGAGATPGGTASAVDAYFGKRGINMVNYIRSMGGPTGVFEQLADANKAFASGQNTGDLNSRLRRILGAGVHGQLQARGGNALAQHSNLMMILNTLDPTTGGKLMDAVSAGGSDSALSAIISGSNVGGVTSTATALLNAAKGLGGAFGAGTSGVYGNALRLQTANPLTQNLLSAQGQALLNAAAWRETGSIGPENFRLLQQELAGNARGQFKGTILQGILDRAGGTDPQSQLAMALGTAEGRKNIVGAYQKNGNWLLRTFDLSRDNLGGANGVKELTDFRDALRMVNGGAEVIAAAGLGGNIDPTVAAAFGGRYALDPDATLGHRLSAFNIGGRESFVNKTFQKRTKDYAQQLATLSKIHGYLNDPTGPVTATPFVKASLNKQLDALRNLVMDPNKKLDDNFAFYDQLTKTDWSSIFGPDEFKSLGRMDAQFAQEAANTPTNDKIKEALKAAGAGAIVYQLEGNINASDPSSIQLGNIIIKPRTTK